jgi:hypothetical protein
MTPRFPRTRRFAHPHGLTAVDAIFMILWLSAFAAVASWNSTGKCGNGCSKSKAIVALGVFVWYVPFIPYPIKAIANLRLPICRLLFILTTIMSVYAISYYNREGYLPGLSRAPTNAQMIDPDKDAFSTAPADDYAPVHNTDDHEIHDYPAAGSSGLGEQRYDGPAPSYGGAYEPTVAQEDTGYTGYNGTQPQIGGRVQFPTARYDNI